MRNVIDLSMKTFLTSDKRCGFKTGIRNGIIFILDYRSIRNTTPERFKNLGYDDTCVHLQRINWRDYKHHITLKVLVCIAPNSRTIFCLNHMVIKFPIEK